MRKFLFILLLVSGLSQAKDISQHVATEQTTSEFKNCRETTQMKGLVEKLMKSNSAIEKMDSHFSFPLKGSVLGLPIKGIWIGVCNQSGERRCGWGAMRAFVIDLPFNKAKEDLKRNFKIDFTVEKRDDEVEATERPVLAYLKKEKTTILFCDPGSL